MANLARAHHELFRRAPDECFDAFSALHAHCREQRERSADLWQLPKDVVLTHDLTLCAGGDGSELALNDWSFSQLCRMAGVSKETLNRLSLKTASRALQETLPRGDKPLQVLASGGNLARAVHGAAYTRLWNAELLDVVGEFASDFTPPPTATDGVHTGLYCGEQDLFCFLIDPSGWIEIEGQAFAPGLFTWNSEVGRRSLGIQTFWFQKVCRNHLVHDAIEVVDFQRKHTANVREGLNEIRALIDRLLARRDERRDGFARIVERAMRQRLGGHVEEAMKTLRGQGLPPKLVGEALRLAEGRGELTLFAVVDALTQASQKIRYAGDRAALDARIGQLLSLAA